MHEERMHAMGVVASGLAHDLNHSLNVIALRIATLRADARFDPARRSLEGLGRVVDEAAATVARLQDLARRRRDRPAESVDLTAVLLGAIEMARTELDGTGAELHIDEAELEGLPAGIQSPTRKVARMANKRPAARSTVGTTSLALRVGEWVPRRVKRHQRA